MNKQSARYLAKGLASVGICIGGAILFDSSLVLIGLLIIWIGEPFVYSMFEDE